MAQKSSSHCHLKTSRLGDGVRACVCEVRQGKSSWRCAAQQQPLGRSQITSGCKQHRPAPRQPASLSTEGQQKVWTRGLHHPSTVLDGMRSLVAVALVVASRSRSQWIADESQMRKSKRDFGTPAEGKSGNLKYGSTEEAAQLFLFIPFHYRHTQVNVIQSVST